LKKAYTILMMLLAALPVFTGEPTAAVSLLSDYTWRGLQVGDNPVIQPSIGYSLKNWNFNVWGNMDLTDKQDEQFEFNRVDYTCSYDRIFSKFMMSLGAVYYSYPQGGDDDTYELFLGSSFDHWLKPTLMLYRDLDAIKGTYAQLGLFPSTSLFENQRSGGLELVCVLSYGSESYKSGYFNMRHNPDMHHGPGEPQNKQASSGLLQYEIGLDYPMQFFDGELTFSLFYIDLVDSDIKSPGFEDDSSAVIFEVSYSIHF